MEFTLLGSAAVAVVALYAVLWFEAGRTNSADCTRQVWDAAITSIVAGVFVGRLAAMVLAGTNPITAAGDILIVRGGVDTVAATVAAVGTYGFLVRRDLWVLLDAAAAAGLAALAAWHGACLARDACLGEVSTLPWAWSQGASAATRHPVEIYAALVFALAALIVLWVKTRARDRPGVAALGAVTAAAVIRLATEPLRLGIGADLAPWYSAGAVVGLLALGWRIRVSTPNSPTTEVT